VVTVFKGFTVKLADKPAADLKATFFTSILKKYLLIHPPPYLYDFIQIASWDHGNKDMLLLLGIF